MERFKLKIKPLSTNEMHLGRKVDSTKYRKWSAQVCRMLPPREQLKIDFTKPLMIHVDVWFKSRLSDLDNIWKPLLDAMQRAYPDFNDNKVVIMSGAKRITKDEDELGYLIRLTNCAEPE
ncbi:hypothetical protein ACIL2V_002733 [Vibrio alginolyticus]